MNKTIAFLAMLMLLCLSCSNDGGNPTPSSSSGGNGGFPMEGGQVYDNGGARNPYIGSGKIYLADERDSNGQPILTAEAMVEAGTVSNGKITFVLPTSIDSRFLMKFKSSAGMNVEPPVEVWPYTDPLRLLSSNGEHIGNLEYAKMPENDGVYHKVTYWYFSEPARINGSANEGGGISEYKVDAKSGWNEVYMRMNVVAENIYVTTDLSEVPDGLMWLMRERN